MPNLPEYLRQTMPPGARLVGPEELNAFSRSARQHTTAHADLYGAVDNNAIWCSRMTGSGGATWYCTTRPASWFKRQETTHEVL